MKSDEFRRMWDEMQRDGYFTNHPHYTDFLGHTPSKEDLELDNAVIALNFETQNVSMPVPYSDSLERSIKRTESLWLYKMFDLPRTGTALDIGCGFGRSVSWMADNYDKVIGTDISKHVIAAATKNFEHLDNIAFYVNGPDSLPADILPASVDVAYIFTVLQHIPREYTQNILCSVERVLKPGGRVVFNLLSNINEELNEGEQHTEWAIGYSEDQARNLLRDSGLREERLVYWGRPETAINWLWVSGIKQ